MAIIHIIRWDCDRWKSHWRLCSFSDVGLPITCTPTIALQMLSCLLSPLTSLPPTSSPSRDWISWPWTLMTLMNHWYPVPHLPDADHHQHFLFESIINNKTYELYKALLHLFISPGPHNPVCLGTCTWVRAFLIFILRIRNLKSFDLPWDTRILGSRAPFADFLASALSSLPCCILTILSAHWPIYWFQIYFWLQVLKCLLFVFCLWGSTSHFPL